MVLEIRCALQAVASRFEAMNKLTLPRGCNTQSPATGSGQHKANANIRVDSDDSGPAREGGDISSSLGRTSTRLDVGKKVLWELVMFVDWKVGWSGVRE
jgi:hypothetical protein